MTGSRTTSSRRPELARRRGVACLLRSPRARSPRFTCISVPGRRSRARAGRVRPHGDRTAPSGATAELVRRPAIARVCGFASRTTWRWSTAASRLGRSWRAPTSAPERHRHVGVRVDHRAAITEPRRFSGVDARAASRRASHTDVRIGVARWSGGPRAGRRSRSRWRSDGARHRERDELADLRAG